MRKGHGKALTYYDIGATPFFALQSEPRLSYCLYVPESYQEAGDRRYPLIVLVHGTERGAARYRDEFAAFAEEYHCIVLAPLFPANLFGPKDLDNYKLIDFGGVRFDHCLLDMVAELEGKYRIDGNRFLLHGFSGGGHFTHRFLFLHPQRLAAASIGAPGVVTLLNTSRDWWIGVGNLEEVFGVALSLDAIRRVPVQGVVGGDDVETWEITIPEDSPWYMEGANSAGANRIERMESLCATLRDAGVDVTLDKVPGVAHNGWQVLPQVRRFFAEQLTRWPGNGLEAQ